MSGGIEPGKSRFQGQRCIVKRGDGHTPFFHGNPNPLIDMQVGRTRDSCRQPHPEIAPLFQIKNSLYLCHDYAPFDRCLDAG